MKLTGGEAVVAALEALGIRHVFGIVSVHNLPIVDAISRCALQFVETRHEQGAAHKRGRLRPRHRWARRVPRQHGPRHGQRHGWPARGAARIVTGADHHGAVRDTVVRQGPQHHPRDGAPARHAALGHPARRARESTTPTSTPPSSLAAHDIGSGRPQPGAVEIPHRSAVRQRRHRHVAARRARSSPAGSCAGVPGRRAAGRGRPPAPSGPAAAWCRPAPGTTCAGSPNGSARR